jgi:hypothetical protein
MRTLFLSLDPYMRGRMSDSASYAAPVALGEVMVGATVCRVDSSQHPGFAAGDLVLAYTGWQDYAVSDGTGLTKLAPQMAQPSHALGELGMPGFTAYMGLLDIGQPKAGETVVRPPARLAGGGQIANPKAAAWWALPAARTSAAPLWKNSVLTHASTTTARTWPRCWQQPARKALTCILKTWAAKCLTPCCRCSTPAPACRCAA